VQPKVLKAMAKADSNLAVPLNAAKHSILRLMDDLVEMQQVATLIDFLSFKLCTDSPRAARVCRPRSTCQTDQALWR